MENILQQAESLFKNSTNNISLLANASAFLNEHLNNINWVGFYLYIDNKLHLGPFQGKIACTEISLKVGVCGHAFSTQQTVNVDDVNKFKSHIVCDIASKSELVVPLTKAGQKIGVLDIDSPIYNRFDTNTIVFVESIVKIILNYYIL